MSLRDLQDKYGGRGNEAIRRALRAEMDGGADCLDALVLAHRLARRMQSGTQPHALAQRTLDALREMANGMEAEVCRRHGIPTSGPATTATARFQAARKRRGLTQTAVAQVLGVSPQRINHIEAGRDGAPSLNWLLRAARMLGWDPAELDPSLATTTPKREIP